MRNKHKYIESYNISEHESGVIQLTFNCTQRELYYHRFTDNNYLICGTEEEFDNGYYQSDLTIDIDMDSILTKERAFMFRCATSKDKETITFYFIPYQRDYIKTRKNLTIKK